MKISFVYILLCSDGTYYTGVTSNIEKRYEQHQSAKYKDSYTANRLPVELVFYATFFMSKAAWAFILPAKPMTANMAIL